MRSRPENIIFHSRAAHGLLVRGAIRALTLYLNHFKVRLALLKRVVAWIRKVKDLAAFR
jgi:hypothetical protein